jgi:CO/xanthine dehydrogenase Mo-binding subunit
MACRAPGAYWERRADEGTAAPAAGAAKVRHVGDPVAMVIADSVEAARDAAERLFSHVALSETGKGTSWGEQVRDTEYKMDPAAN